MLNICEDFYSSYATKQEQKQLEEERMKLSSCTKIKPHKYNKETAEYTRSQLNKLLKSEAYTKHMANRNGESVNWQAD